MLERCFFYCLKDSIHHLRNYRVSVGFEGFGSPLRLRNGKVVQRKGKPIISSVNRGDSRKVPPSVFGQESCKAFATTPSRRAFLSSAIFSFARFRFTILFALGVGRIPIAAKSFSSIVYPCSFFLAILAPSGELGFFSSLAVGVGRRPEAAIAERLVPICEPGVNLSLYFSYSPAVGVGNSILPTTVSRFGNRLPCMFPSVSSAAPIAEQLRGVGSIP